MAWWCSGPRRIGVVGDGGAALAEALATKQARRVFRGVACLRAEGVEHGQCGPMTPRRAPRDANLRLDVCYEHVREEAMTGSIGQDGVGIVPVDGGRRGNVRRI